jgi:multiple sugar transport system substrate-binding protein
LLSGRISRREFMRRAAIAGMSAAAAGAALSTAARAQSPSAAGGGAFDPMRYAGSTVKVLLVASERDEMGLLDKAPEILETMGITVEVTTLPIGDQLPRVTANLTADTSEFDIIDILGFTVAATVGADLMAPLNAYVDDPSATPADYDLPDFPQGALDYCGYFDVANGTFGGSDLYLIPGVHSGSCMLFYRKDLFDAAGLQPPTTWQDFQAAAEALNTDDVAGACIMGSAGELSLFLADWYSRFITTGGVLMSGSAATKDFTPNLTSPEAVNALQLMLDVLPFAPDGVAQYTLTEELQAFNAGKVAQMVCWTTIAGGAYDPEQSLVADKVAVATMPADAGQTPRAVRGGWGLGIPKNLPDERKGAAWQLMTYLTSKEFEQYQVGTYKTDPNRSSTFADAELVAELPYLPVAGQAAESAQLLEIAGLPVAFELMTAADREFNLAIAGSQDAAAACQAAQTAWEAILQREGYLEA